MLAVVLVLVLMFLPGFWNAAAWVPLFGLWGTLNAGFALVAAGWSLFHLRAVLPARGIATRWALGISLLACLWIPFLIAQGMARLLGMAVSSVAIAAVSVVVFGLVLTATAVGCLLLAATGAWAARNLPEPGRNCAAGAGVAAAGITLVAAALFGSGRIPYLSALVGPLLILGLPAAALAGGWAAAGDRLGPFSSLDGFSSWLEQRLVVGRRRWDLRGPVLGLLAVMPVFALGQVQFFAPLQAAALVGLIRIRNQPIIASEIPMSLGSIDQPALRKAQEQIVLLRLDASTRRGIATSTSEAALQAQAVRKLKQWGARLVVLPAPLLEPAPDVMGRSRWDVPLLVKEETERSRRDLPELARAMREAGNVILCLGDPMDRMIGTRFSTDDAQMERAVGAMTGNAGSEYLDLTKAALSVGTDQLGAMGDVRLPTLRIALNNLRATAPIPLSIARAIRPTEVPARSLLPVGFSPTGPSTDKGLGAVGELLLDIRSAQPGRGFTWVDYRSLLDGEPVFTRQAPTGDPEHPSRGEWRPAASFYRDKIVFLEPMAGYTRETAVGIMPRSEVMAHGTAMLLAGTVLTLAPVGPYFAGVLALGVLVGVLCNRRSPGQSFACAGGLAVLVGVAAAAAMTENVWLDPITPWFAIAAALLLVVQVTFARERLERQRIGGIMERYLPPALLSSFMAPKQNAERSLALLGDRRNVCVLFADIRNFTQFAERHPPELVVATTNRYLTAMAEALFTHGGILDKFTGDGLMAFFLVDGPDRLGSSTISSPVEHVGVQQAVRAAVAMRDAAQCVSEELRSEGKEWLQIGLGVHYGPAVVGLVGSPKRPDYTALGHAVIVSHRLQGLASGGEIVISETVYLATRDVFRSEAGEPVQVKGITELMTPYRVLEALPAPELGAVIQDGRG